jgi:hypothetical protein
MMANNDYSNSATVGFRPGCMADALGQPRLDSNVWVASSTSRLPKPESYALPSRSVANAHRFR